MQNEGLKLQEKPYTSPEWLDTSTLVTDSAILALLIIVELTLFIKVKFKIDFSGKLTLLLLLAASVIRFIADFQDIGTETFLILITVCTTLIWLSLYYFVFEMLLIKYLIQETYVNQFNKKKHLVGLCKWVTIVFNITYVILISLHQIKID